MHFHRPARIAGCVFAALIAAILPLRSSVAAEADYVSAGEATAIAAGSAGLLVVGLSVASFDSAHSAHWTGPLPGERRLQRLLGGTYRPDKTNVFDRRIGGAIVPAVALVTIVSSDLGWPAADRNRDLGQDMLLFTGGLLTVEGLTGIAKGLVKRARPMIALEPDLARQRRKSSYDYDRRSFLSGHTSSAFFAMTYANKRVRSTMYREMDRNRYRDWRWLPPVIAYGSATLVGWSRIAAYDHFVSDVAVGALVGWLTAELFYRYGDRTYRDLENGASSPLYVAIRIPLK